MIIIQSYLWEEVNGMNKTDLINAVAEASSLSKKDATKAVDAVFDSILEALKQGDKVQLIGFGNFEVRERAARKGRNPQTGEEIEIAASKVPAFKPGKALKMRLNNFITCLYSREEEFKSFLETLLFAFKNINMLECVRKVSYVGYFGRASGWQKLI